MQDERRGSGRDTVSMSGTVLVNDAGNTAIPCTIHDLSDGGAQISVDRSHVLPAKFDLVIAQERRSASVRWHLGERIGLSFEG